MSKASESQSTVLVIGGAGLVGSLIVPRLSDDWQIRVLDPQKPKYSARFEYVEGTSTDYPALQRAFEGIDAFVYLAMGPKDPAVWERPELAALQFDMAVKGVYLTMRAAVEAAVLRGVYASSMSVFADFPSEAGAIGDAPADATHFYGLAKRLGEEIITSAIIDHPSMSVVSLRLCLPMTDEDWLATKEPIAVTIGTAGSDVASAFEAALRYIPKGFVPIPIAGDRYERYVDLSTAKELLGWKPLVEHPLASAVVQERKPLELPATPKRR